MADGGYVPPLTTQRSLASTGGGATSLSLSLAEPVLFLTGGFESSERTTERPAMLRGTLMVKLAKASKLKAITLQFSGKSRTEWPEGIPPKKQEFWEEKELMNHTWTFFNAQFPMHEHTHGADQFVTADANAAPSTTGNDIASTLPIGRAATSERTSNHSPSASLSSLLPMSTAKSFSKNEAATTQMKGHRVFAAGEYFYNFELPIPSFLPETIQCDMGRVGYELNATVDRAGAFKSNLAGKMDLELIRTPGEANLEASEPIAISRNWEDQLHYDIVISGKSFPLGQNIPIAFKLTPLAKVRVHRIKIFLTETVEYWCKNKKVHRLEPTRKILLLEKNAGVSGGANESLLGNIDGASNAGATEFDLEVKLPGCNSTGKEKVHFDTTFNNIKVHHWIKVVLRLSKADPQPGDPAKRRHFEISIDSPIHLLSCRCTNANTQLPTYSDSSLAVNARLPCPCEVAAGDLSSIQSNPPPSAFGAPDQGTTRPMHLLRQPSHLPPPFTADVPPPLMTPPPGYDYTPGQRQGALDYFTQLSVDDSNEVDRASDDSEVGRRTPGLYPTSFASSPSNGFFPPTANGTSATNLTGYERARRGSAIELSNSTRWGDSSGSFYSRQSPPTPTSPTATFSGAVPPLSRTSGSMLPPSRPTNFSRPAPALSSANGLRPPQSPTTMTNSLFEAVAPSTSTAGPLRNGKLPSSSQSNSSPELTMDEFMREMERPK